MELDRLQKIIKAKQTNSTRSQAMELLQGIYAVHGTYSITKTPEGGMTIEQTFPPDVCLVIKQYEELIASIDREIEESFGET